MLLKFIMKYKLDSNNYYELLFMDDKKRNLLLWFLVVIYRDSKSWEVPKAFSPDQPYNQAIFFIERINCFIPLTWRWNKFLKIKGHPLLIKYLSLDLVPVGHYAAMLATSYYDYIDKLVLCYPVITTDIEFCSQKNSFELIRWKLLWWNRSNKYLYKAYSSLFPTDVYYAYIFWWTCFNRK